MIASLAYWVQACARVQRKGGGSVAYVWDFMGNAERLGSPLQMVIPKPFAEKKVAEKQICDRCDKEYRKIPFHSWIEDEIKWTQTKRSCCRFEELSGTELPSTLCPHCDCSFVVEETKREINDIVTTCPHCSGKVVLEVIAPLELITLVQDKEEFVLQMMSILRENEKNKNKLDAFKKWLFVYTSFTHEDVLRDDLDSILGLSDGLRNYSRVPEIVKQAKEYRYDYPFLMRFFNDKNFDLNVFSDLAPEIVETAKEIPTYTAQLKRKLSDWGFTNGLPVDFKKLAQNVRRNITLETKKYNKLKPMANFMECDSGRSEVNKEVGPKGDCATRAFTEMTKLKYGQVFDTVKRLVGNPNNGVSLSDIADLAKFYNYKLIGGNFRNFKREILFGFEYGVIIPGHMYFVNGFGVRVDVHNNNNSKPNALVIKADDELEILKLLGKGYNSI
jgi:hypothetical protein